MSNGRVLRVFISSTFKGFVDHRDAADRAIRNCGHLPIRFDRNIADPEPTVVKIEQAIDSCDIFILILGHKYGTINTKSEKLISYTHEEFNRAVGKKHILAFVQESKEILELQRDQKEGTDENIKNKYKELYTSATDEKYFSHSKWSSENPVGFGVSLGEAIREAVDKLQKANSLHTDVMDRLEEFSKVGGRSWEELPIKLTIAT